MICDANSSPRQTEISSHVAHRQSLDIARYVLDMAAQLEAMAVSARLDLLSYFLCMVKSEADLYVRANSAVDHSPMESGEIEPETPRDNPSG